MTIGLPHPWLGDPTLQWPHIRFLYVESAISSSAFFRSRLRDGHPCLDGWFRSSRSMGDFHPLNASHTEHTRAEALPHGDAVKKYAEKVCEQCGAEIGRASC